MTQVSNPVHPAEVLADSYRKPKALHRTTVVVEVKDWAGGQSQDCPNDRCAQVVSRGTIDMIWGMPGSTVLTGRLDF